MWVHEQIPLISQQPSPSNDDADIKIGIGAHTIDISNYQHCRLYSVRTVCMHIANTRHANV